MSQSEHLLLLKALDEQKELRARLQEAREFITRLEIRVSNLEKTEKGSRKAA
jgi:hypothetical protein